MLAPSSRDRPAVREISAACELPKSVRRSDASGTRENGRFYRCDGVRVVQENRNQDQGGPRYDPGPPRASDPDMLRDLLQQSRGVPLSVQRITSAEVQSLKVTQRKEDNPGVAFKRAVSGCFSSFFHAIGALFTGSSKK